MKEAERQQTTTQPGSALPGDGAGEAGGEQPAEPAAPAGSGEAEPGPAAE